MTSQEGSAAQRGGVATRTTDHGGLPIEPRRRESVDDYRDRMAAKAARARKFLLGEPVVVKLIPQPAAEPASTATDAIATTRATEAAPKRPARTQRTRTTARRPRRSASPSRQTPRRVPGTPAEPATPAVDLEALVGEYLGGNPLADVATRHAIPARQAASLLRGSGVRLRAGDAPTRQETRSTATTSTGAPRFVDADERTQIAQAYQAGESAPTIAARHGRNPATIRAALRAADVELRDDRSTRSGGTRKTAADDPPDLVEAVVTAYRAGATLAQIAHDVTGVGSPKHASGLLTRAGVTLRPPRSVTSLTDTLLEEVKAASRAGESQAQISARLGVAQTTVSRWLRGVRTPRTT
jgi:hypothetical protein